MTKEEHYYTRYTVVEHLHSKLIRVHSLGCNALYGLVDYVRNSRQWSGSFLLLRLTEIRIISYKIEKLALFYHGRKGNTDKKTTSPRSCKLKYR
jgi:hypothetical protein